MYIPWDSGKTKISSVDESNNAQPWPLYRLSFYVDIRLVHYVHLVPSMCFLTTMTKYTLFRTIHLDSSDWVGVHVVCLI